MHQARLIPPYPPWMLARQPWCDRGSAVSLRQLAVYHVQHHEPVLNLSSVAALSADLTGAVCVCICVLLLLQAPCLVVLADSLQRVASHSRRVNTDTQLRRRLAQQQVEDRVPEDKQVCVHVFCVCVCVSVSRGKGLVCCRAWAFAAGCWPAPRTPSTHWLFRTTT